MAPIRIKHVISFTSQDPQNGVENLCRVAADGRPWLSDPQDRSGVLKVELQLEQVAAVGFVDVGNCGSAFIQIDAGRSSWSQDRPYVVLLPTATLMSPVDSQDGRGRHAVRMFKKADFLSEGLDQMWDRLRVTCTQPYRRNAQFGLSFLQVRSPEDTPTFTVQEAPTTPDKRTAVEEWLSSPVVQRTFFGTKTIRSPVNLSRTERMLLTAASRSLPQPPCRGSSSPPIRRQRWTPNSPSTRAKRPQASAATSRVEEPKTPRSRQKQRHGATHCPSPAASSHQTLVEPETVCPLCGVVYSADLLRLHAASCMESEPPTSHSADLESWL
ncbi:protein XNDC1N [Denticeps clupeoides]|uniref:protein XNDC1N n=1 Tax=Denticeps clupeoides TaxID=299321 RepID=UPI0010A2BAAA|nr:DNA repair protein XRCC1-like [Denticeps clupeoides]